MRLLEINKKDHTSVHFAASFFSCLVSLSFGAPASEQWHLWKIKNKHPWLIIVPSQCGCCECSHQRSKTKTRYQSSNLHPLNTNISRAACVDWTSDKNISPIHILPCHVASHTPWGGWVWFAWEYTSTLRHFHAHSLRSSRELTSRSHFCALCGILFLLSRLAQFWRSGERAMTSLKNKKQTPLTDHRSKSMRLLWVQPPKV